MQEKRNYKKNVVIMRKVYDLVMALLILSMSAAMFFGDRWGISAIEELDGLMRNLFGGLCLIYGLFRLYRAIMIKPA